MTAENKYKELLEEVCEKLDNIDNVKEVDVLDIKNSVESIENLITDTQAKLNFQDIKEKLEKIAFQVDSCNEALLKDLYNDLNTIKETTGSVGQHLENLQNVQNLALTSAEFEEYQKQQLDLALKTNENIFKEIKTLNNNIENSDNHADTKNIETQINNLHKTLTGYIEQVVSKIELVPGVEEIGSVVSDLNSVQQKSIKQTNALIKDVEAKLTEFKTSFDKKDLSDQLSKIGEIYDSLGMILAWIEKVGYINQSIENVYARLGESIDFDDVSEKVDIIYENITALNNWTMKIDNVDESMQDIQSKLSYLSNYMSETQNITSVIESLKEKMNSAVKEQFNFEDIENKMDVVYENLSAVNEWASRIDNLSEKVDGINNVIEEESIASKIDVVYENISLLNDWVKKIDNLTNRSEELDIKYSETNENLNIKIDEINEILSRALKIVEEVPDVKDKLEELSSELHAITNGTKNDTDSYIYTLLDIESDFLKLHKSLDDNSKNTSNDINALKERFAELNDDISSISIRTNKLILSADDANKEFKTCLETFKSTLQELDVQRQEFNPELKFAMLTDKVNEMASLIKDSVVTSKNLNNAFIYLADWVDATGSMLNNMNSDLAAVRNDNSTAVNLKLLSGDVADLMKKVEEVEVSFNKYKKNDIPVLNEALSYIITKADELSENIAKENLNELKSLHNEFSPIHDEISNLGSIVETARDEFSNVNTGIEKLNETVSSINSEVSFTNEGMESIKNCLTVVGEAIDGLNNKLNIDDTNESSLKDDLSAIKDEIKDIKQSFKNVDEMVSDLKTDDISELKSSLTGIMVQLNTALTPDIDTLNERIDKLVEEHNNHINKFEEIVEEKLEKQEQKIISIEGKVEIVNSKIDKLIETMNDGNKNDEVKDILNYIVTQLTASNESITTNQQNAHKVLDNVAAKVSSFDENINKIVSYIEEE